MLTYGLYFLKNNRLERWQDIEALHDLDAIETARGFAGEHSVELWLNQRKITTFAPGASPEQRETGVIASFETG